MEKYSGSRKGEYDPHYSTEDVQDCFGVKRNEGRKYFYGAIVAIVLLLVLLASVITATIVLDQPNEAGSQRQIQTLEPSSNPTNPATQDPTSSPSPLPVTAQPTDLPSHEPTVQKQLMFMNGSRPNIVVVMMDDLGYHDTAIYGQTRDKVRQATPVLTGLSKEGIILTNHYAHWHCSPSRRSFLTGRLPHHTGEENSEHHDDTDLRWTWVSSKLKQADYSCFWVGKLHTGFLSYNQLPLQQGFDGFVGILQGKGPYRNFVVWRDNRPDFGKTISDYNTRYYRKQAEKMISTHLAANRDLPFFMVLSLQTPHTPIEPPLNNDPDYMSYPQKELYPYEYMIFAADKEIGELVKHLKRENIWSNTFFLFLSDNGATIKDVPAPRGSPGTRGNNYPLRGEKSTNFEGGLRVATFVAGGVIPASLRGTKNAVVSHIADWYSTFCHLAGVNDSDDPPTPPQDPDPNIDPIYPANAVGGVLVNLWDSSYAASDSKSLLPHLIEPENKDPYSLRPEGLVLGLETIILGKHKLMTAQPCPLDTRTDSCKRNKAFGWLLADAITFDNSYDESMGCLRRFRFDRQVQPQFEPCLFDLEQDEREKSPINNNPDKFFELWSALNRSLVYQYHKGLVGKHDGLSPKEMLGRCVSRERAARCLGANRYLDHLPLCGIPNC